MNPEDPSVLFLRLETIAQAVRALVISFILHLGLFAVFSDMPHRSRIIIHQIRVPVLMCLLAVLPAVSDINDRHDAFPPQLPDDLAADIAFVAQEVPALSQPSLMTGRQLIQQLPGLGLFARRRFRHRKRDRHFIGGIGDQMKAEPEPFFRLGYYLAGQAADAVLFLTPVGIMFSAQAAFLTFLFMSGFMRFKSFTAYP